MNIALQRLEIAIESFGLQKGKFTLTSCPVQQIFFHQLVDCFRVAVEMLEIEENEGENLGVVPFEIEKQQRYF